MEETMHTLRTLAVTTATVAALTAAITAPAQARPDDRIERTGGCSGSADWKLKAKSDDGRIEVEGEIDTNRNGQVWRWRIKHNGDTSAHGRARTHAPSGSFSVERKMTNLAGTDRFVFRAVRGSQVCRGAISF
jgi:hypothetical protein